MQRIVYCGCRTDDDNWEHDADYILAKHDVLIADDDFYVINLQDDDNPDDEQYIKHDGSLASFNPYKMKSWTVLFLPAFLHS